MRWNLFLKILFETHGEVINRTCKVYEPLVQDMFCGTLNTQQRFLFEELDEITLDTGAEDPLNVV